MILVNQKTEKLTAFFVSQAEIKTTTQFGFEIELSRIYTRAVFADFKQTHYRITAFRSEQSTATQQSIWCATTTSLMIFIGQDTSSRLLMM